MDLQRLQLRGQSLHADLAEAITSLRIDAKPGAVTDLTITALDSRGLLAKAGLMDAGTVLTWRGGKRITTGHGRTVPREGSSTISVTTRSPIAAELRATYRSSVQHKVSPTEWVTQRVQAAGGVAVCQPSATKGSIAQTSGDKRQSELDVIAGLASQLGWSWCERDEAFWFGSRHWAWTQNPSGQATWKITHRTDADRDLLEADFNSDSDSQDDEASGTITVPYSTGIQMQPWDLIQVSGVGTPWSGLWLVEGINYTADLVSPITVPISRPKAPAKKTGSTA